MISNDEKWARKKVIKKVGSVLKVVGEAACRSETQTKIPLKVTDGKAKEVLLADLVIDRLKDLGFKVYYCECGTKRIAREYYVIWGRNSKIPEGCSPV